jgi:hypothetical protein
MQHNNHYLIIPSKFQIEQLSGEVEVREFTQTRTDIPNCRYQAADRMLASFTVKKEKDGGRVNKRDFIMPMIYASNLEDD